MNAKEPNTLETYGLRGFDTFIKNISVWLKNYNSEEITDDKIKQKLAVIKQISDIMDNNEVAFERVRKKDL